MFFAHQKRLVDVCYFCFPWTRTCLVVCKASPGPFFNKCRPAVGWPAWEWLMRRHVDLLIFWDTWTVVDCWVEPYLSFLYPIPSFSESYSIDVFSWYRCVFLPMVHVWFILIHTYIIWNYPLSCLLQLLSLVDYVARSPYPIHFARVWVKI